MPKSFKRILMVYPEFPVTYWGFQCSLPLIDKKAAMPPLGLLTIAAMTPRVRMPYRRSQLWTAVCCGSRLG